MTPKLLQVSSPPEGFSYQPEFLTRDEESSLLARFANLSFRAFNFQGYVAKRRIIEYGYEYDFSSRRQTPTQPIPDFLQPFKIRAAEWANINVDEFIEAIITEYSPGTQIGWHRDIPRFESILGISLGSSCRFRFKPYKAEGKIESVTLQPRSAYVMQGPARWNFQHSIPAVQSLRYSITLRTSRKR